MILNTSTDNVGIGTAIASSKLHVNGAVRIDSSNALSFGTYGGGFNMSDVNWIRTFGSKNFYHDVGIMRTDGTLQVGQSGGTFNVVNSGDLSYRTSTLVATTTGRVGIGTAAPATLFHVEPIIKVTATRIEFY